MHLLAKLLLITSVLALGACHSSDVPTTTATDAEVGIVVVQPSSVRLFRELPGRVSPTRIAEVRPRVSGPIMKRSFEQGTFVMPGDVLYEIDPKPFSVTLEIANAQLSKAEAIASQARQTAGRTAALVTRQTVSEAQNDAAVAGQRQAEAEVAAARATVERAALDLAYATVRAPIAGQVGRALVTEGAMVQAGTTHLATVQALDPIYVDFTQSVTELSQLRRNIDTGVLQGLSADEAKISLLLEDGSRYEQGGKLLFSDASVDPSTGQVTLRGEFPNPRRELLPGMYVRGEVAEGVDSDAITIPSQAVQRTSAGESEVWIVKADNVVERKAIRISRVINGSTLVSDGLSANERVVVDGFQKITAGAKVRPIDWKTPETAPQAQAR